MQNCLGIYIENNLIKYAKVSKDKEDLKIETYGIKFFDDNLNIEIKKLIEETNSYNTPISINLKNEKYLYFDVFALLSKNDIQMTVQTEYETYCDENKYNQKAFETRYALVPNVKDKDKIKAIQVIVDKIELNKQKQCFEKNKLEKILPIGTAISSIAKLEKKENALIVNMEEKTTVTTIYDRQLYDVQILDVGSQEVLEKINKTENSISKSYEICKGTTIYTADIIDDTKDQPYLQAIVPTLYRIAHEVYQIMKESPLKITKIYLTGTLAIVNNVDLYFQEILPIDDCKILKPAIAEKMMAQINIKDYIEVNSAIALAVQALENGMKSLNFMQSTFMDTLKEKMNTEITFGNKTGKKKKSVTKKSIDFSLKNPLDKTEVILLRCIITIILICVIFTIFSKLLYSQMEKEQEKIAELISAESGEIEKIKEDTDALNLKTTEYETLTESLKAINDKISNIEERKNSIPNLLNQITYIVPEGVQLTSIKNTTDRNIEIIARSDNYDQLGYFIAKIKLEGILNNTTSSSGEKNEGLVTVKIEGELP